MNEERISKREGRWWTMNIGLTSWISESILVRSLNKWKSNRNDFQGQVIYSRPTHISQYSKAYRAPFSINSLNYFQVKCNWYITHFLRLLKEFLLSWTTVTMSIVSYTIFVHRLQDNIAFLQSIIGLLYFHFCLFWCFVIKIKK